MGYLSQLNSKFFRILKKKILKVGREEVIIKVV